jgi:hypothetical protein
LRWLVLSILTVGLTAPAFALTVSAAEERPTPRQNRRVCRSVVKQIAHFEDVAGLARERGDERWERATEQQLERLRARQRTRCPHQVGPDLGKRIATALRTIGRLALRAASLGLL